MAERTKVEVQLRTDKGKGAAGRLRRSGSIPAIVYGHGLENTMVSIPVDSVHTVATAHGLVELVIGGNVKPVLVRGMQRDCIKDVVTHVDFQIVRMDEKISTTVPLVAVGEAAGVDNGGVLDQIMHEIEIECLPGDMPERIEYDVSHMAIDDVVTITDLTLPNGVEAVYTDADMPVFSCSMPRMEEAEPAEGEGDLLEPELIGKDEEDEESE